MCSLALAWPSWFFFGGEALLIEARPAGDSRFVQVEVIALMLLLTIYFSSNIFKHSNALQLAWQEKYFGHTLCECELPTATELQLQIEVISGISQVKAVRLIARSVNVNILSEE